MDMRMPEISGAELCQLMKAKIPADVKIYAMTAQVLPEELESVLKQGFDGLIMKPFRENDLLAVFSSTLLTKEGEGEKEKEETETDDFSGIGLDTTVVEKMTFGDQELLLKILNRFKEDCEHDMVELQNSITANDQPLARLVVHRIAGRTAQMGSGNLASAFRIMEMELSEVQDIESAHQEKLELLIKKLRLLLQLVDQKIG
jgi:CheY-like chemotaxis protein